MPNWVLPSAVELGEKRRSTTLLSLVIAAWIKFLQSSTDERGSAIEVVDVRADELKRAVKLIGNDPRPFIAMKSLFDSAYFAAPSFGSEVEAALTSLSVYGAKETIRRYAAKAK